MNRMVAVLLGAVVMFGGLALATGPLFEGQVVCVGGSYYFPVIAAELDNDGDPDLITADTDENNVTVFLTHADGSFTEPMTYDIGGGSYTLAVGDLNGDGFNDIMVGREVDYDDYVGVLLNTGNGTFAPVADYAVYNTPYGIAAADIDDDGDRDILISTHYYLQVLTNQGTGTFDAAVNYSAANGMNTGLAVGDLDGDGDIDAAVNNYEIDSTQVFVNDGSGNFASAGRYPSGINPNSVDAALINGDAYPDLVITNRSSDKTSILLNNGDGTFAAPVQYTVGFDPQDAALVDIDGDADIDVAVATWTGKGIWVLDNAGDGTFPVIDRYILAETPAVAAGDFDKDGNPDLVSTPSGHQLVVMYNDGAGSFIEPQKSPVGTKAWSVAVGRLDFNAEIDIAVTNFTSGTVTTFINHGDSTFTAGTVTDLPTGAGPKEIVMADLDNTGVDEMIVADFAKDSISVLEFGIPGATNYVAGDGPSCLAAGFLNGDAYVDIVVGNQNGKTFLVYLNDGTGGLEVPTMYMATDSPFDITLADLDGDGDNDLVMANDGSYPGYDQRIFLNDGHGVFTPGPTLPVSYWGNTVLAADIDDDADLDLFFAQDDSKITLYKNDGAGGFPDSIGFDLPFTPIGFFTADLDLDGDLDLSASDRWEGFLAVWYNQGDGTFDKTTHYRLGGYGNSVTGGDLDGDGDMELIAPTSTDAADTLNIFWNRRDLIPVDVGNDPLRPLPDVFTLRQNYPNPFNPATTIAYALPKAAEVTITIYNLLGQTVRSLAPGNQPAGQHQVVWDGKDQSGATVSSGIYFYRLTAGDFVGSKKMVLIK